MKVHCFIITLFSLCFSQLQADFSFDLLTSYRQDQLNWNIAGGNNQPNVLSELEWTNLKIIQIGLRTHLFIPDLFSVRAEGDYGWIYSGKNRDSDYSGDNRTQEFARTYSYANGNNVYDASLGIGRTFCVCGEIIQLTPLIGVSIHGQNLRMHDGTQVIALIPSFLGDIKGLNSTYKAQWLGPWIGVDLGLDLPFTNLWSSLEYHYARYSASGHWNLRDDFLDDFKHHAYGHGFVAKAGFSFSIFGCWLFGVDGSYQIWHTNPGHDSMYFNSITYDDNGNVIDTVPVHTTTRLNRVNWQSWSTSLNLSTFF